ncbi:MAG TPA: putative lipid II flippase FtsW [Gammaproteobacteria bacterium]|nr:putative lipid II flippase FtsW [Gammaproteobacteria bacterium]
MRRQLTSPPAPYDYLLILNVLALILLGLLMVTSASITVSAQELHQPFHYFFRQMIYLIAGCGIGAIIMQFEIETWEHYSWLFLILALLFLTLVIIPGVGRSVNGSMRWIGAGPLGFQVSEFAKLAMIIYMSAYLWRHNEEIKTELSGFLKPMGILAVISLLLLKEPDFGALVVITVTTLGLMFLAGMKIQHFIALFAAALAGLSALAISAPYRLARLTSFMNPWAHPFDSGYQLTQSLIAFGRGGWWGVGLGKSIQKLFYLPEAHTDFLFAVIAEELGLIGTLFVIALFALLVLRVFKIGRRAQELGKHFAGFMAYGFAMWIAIQFVVSIGVNSGILPTKGLTLPFMSYGGSSLLINCMMIALVLRIDYENRVSELGFQE